MLKKSIKAEQIIEAIENLSDIKELGKINDVISNKINSIYSRINVGKQGLEYITKATLDSVMQISNIDLILNSKKDNIVKVTEQLEKISQLMVSVSEVSVNSTQGISIAQQDMINISSADFFVFTDIFGIPYRKLCLQAMH